MSAFQRPRGVDCVIRKENCLFGAAMAINCGTASPPTLPEGLPAVTKHRVLDDNNNENKGLGAWIVIRALNSMSWFSSSDIGQ